MSRDEPTALDCFFCGKPLDRKERIENPVLKFIRVLWHCPHCGREYWKKYGEDTLTSKRERRGRWHGYNPGMSLPKVEPLTLGRKPRPFDSDDWIFEIKHDGFRSLAYIENHHCRLVSRNGNEFKSFPALAEWIGEHLDVKNAILDGEIACLDMFGRSLFNKLFFRKRESTFLPQFCAFDLLWLNGRDARGLPLLERKHLLQGIVPKKPSRIQYMSHWEGESTRLFKLICDLDLEGIVAKRKDSLYNPGARRPAWFKIKNRDYTQAVGREEFFK
jgi:bifunctional non-homologous end joining protein LigD